MLTQEERDNITSEDCQMKTVIAHLRYKLRRDIAMYRSMRDEAQRNHEPEIVKGFQDRMEALEYAWETAVECERMQETMAQVS